MATSCSFEKLSLEEWVCSLPLNRTASFGGLKLSPWEELYVDMGLHVYYESILDPQTTHPYFSVRRGMHDVMIKLNRSLERYLSFFHLARPYWVLYLRRHFSSLNSLSCSHWAKIKIMVHVNQSIQYYGLYFLLRFLGSYNSHKKVSMVKSVVNTVNSFNFLTVIFIYVWANMQTHNMEVNTNMTGSI